MVGPNGLLTNIAGVITFMAAAMFIFLVGKIVAKDGHLMDRKGRYLSYVFTHRKRDAKILIAVWAVAFCSLLSTAFCHPAKRRLVLQNCY